MAKTEPEVSDPCKVDGQGRTIIPKAVRDALGVGVGDKWFVVYEVHGDQVKLRKVKWT